MTFRQRLRLQAEECWRFLWGWIPGAPGAILRRLAYGPLFARAGFFRSGTGVVIQGFANISLGAGAGLNRHVSLYAARGRILMGDNVFIGDFSSINANDAQISIGSNVAVGPMCLLQGANHRFEDRRRPIVAQGHEPSFLVIEDDVWIGAHCVILPGVRVHSGAVVAAGAVVSRDVPPLAVVGGVPARVIRFRGGAKIDAAPEAWQK